MSPRVWASSKLWAPSWLSPAPMECCCLQWKALRALILDRSPEKHRPAEVELRRLVLGRRNWLFTWLDEGSERTCDILPIVATCIAHDVNPRTYLHRVVHCIVHGWPQAKLRHMLRDRMLAAYAELYVGDPDALPVPTAARLLAR